MSKREYQPTTQTEFHFLIYLTESEHGIMEGIVRDKCDELGMEMVYYRKLKLGHRPMYRECKVKGDSIAQFKQWAIHEGSEKKNSALLGSIVETEGLPAYRPKDYDT